MFKDTHVTYSENSQSEILATEATSAMQLSEADDAPKLNNNNLFTKSKQYFTLCFFIKFL